MYFKITNDNTDSLYKYGLNIWNCVFDANNGFTFSSKEFIHHFYCDGIYLRIIELPDLREHSSEEFPDPDFQFIEGSNATPYRANKIIFKEKYLLSDLKIYQKFGLEYQN